MFEEQAAPWPACRGSNQSEVKKAMAEWKPPEPEKAKKKKKKEEEVESWLFSFQCGCFRCLCCIGFMVS